MNISVVGTGYVGLVAGTCFAELGNDVICVDIDEDKVKKLKEGIIPIYEPGLDVLVKRNHKEKRLHFTTDLKSAVESTDVIFLAVGTPMSDDGNADLSAIDAVSKELGECITSYRIIVNKSTVPVGTADRVTKIIKENLKSDVEFDVVSNPEFLREGCAIKDFQNPDRVVVGAPSKKSEEIMIKLYKPVERPRSPIMTTDVRSAEMIKYASNSFLATKISFINEIANLCEKVGADVKEVSKGMGLDTRIGPRFLYAGVGYGGSCFPKDVRALMSTANKHDVDTHIISAVDKTNELQKTKLIPKVREALGEDLKGKKIAILGLSFKPKTDDMREAPSVYMIEELKKMGADIRVFDPVAHDEARKVLKHHDLEYAENPYDALQDVNAVIVVTEWDEFRALDPLKMKEAMKEHHMFDGRNIYEPEDMRAVGFNYHSIGRQ